ncbi:MAG TPA: PAS domain-containing protein [Burkholderiales bacterium]
MKRLSSLHLRLDPRVAGLARAAGPHEAPAGLEPLKVLIVSDRADVEELARLHREEGVDPTVVPTGYQALKMLAGDEGYAAAVLDVRLPAMANLGLAALIRNCEHGRSLPLGILLPQGDERPVRFPGQENAPVELIRQPLEPDRVRGKLKWLIEHERRQRALLLERAERHRLEAALRQSELRYRMIGAATRDLLYDWDALTNTVEWNHAICDEYGYPEEVIESDFDFWYQRVHPEDRGHVSAALDRLLGGPESRWEVAYRFRRADSSYAEVLDRGYVLRDSAGKVVRMLGAMQDQSAQKQAERTLREREERFRRGQERLQRATQAARVGVWEIDLPDWNFWRDEQHDRLFGHEVPLPEWTRETLLAHVHPDDRARVRENQDRAFRERGSYAHEFRVVWPDGTIHWLAAAGRTECDAQGRPVKIIGTVRDATETKAIESELREAVRARDEFLSIASHELKTPLTAISLQAQIIRRAIQPNAPANAIERVPALVDQMDRQVRRLARLVDDMLDISRLALGKLALHREAFDLAELAREIVERMAPEITVIGSTLSLDAPEPVVGHWDRFRIDQVLVNLLTNAARYGEGKPIEVTVRGSAALALLAVRDHGRGIAREDQDRIFQRFERVASEATPGGLGLGLFIVRQILELHEGTIRVESALGEGSAFIVELPRGVPRP